MTPVQPEALTPQPSPAGTLGAAARPTVLFVVAFALNITPHEASHALASYVLGFSSTLFQMWVDPDAASATPVQLSTIAATGPMFSLAVGLICWCLYKKLYRLKPSGLFFLMMAMVGIYSFLGPLAGTAFGGDFNTALQFLEASKPLEYALSTLGLVLLAVFMFFMGVELSWWAPHSFGRAKNVLCTTVAPWLLGLFIIILVYWPLPKSFIGSTFSGSVFWAFAVVGAVVGFSKPRIAHVTPSLTRFDLIASFVAVILVRLLVHGIRLAH
jgi:hypothetical protein